MEPYWGRISFVGTVILLAMGSVGCNQGPAMAPVSGVVMLNDKPLPGGRLIFEPMSSDPGAKSAVGDIADDGTFELFTNEEIVQLKDS